MKMILSGTGHRPEVLGGYDKFDTLVAYARSVVPSYNPTKLITGMALGWDQAIALAAIDLSIPFIAAVPFKGQDAVWPKQSQDLYQEILSKASEVVIVCEGGFASWKYIRRDHYMVNHGDGMLALYNGQKNGGTYQDVRKPVYNVWPGWVAWASS
jgi:uncharacterized phage-like protein YoqJ